MKPKAKMLKMDQVLNSLIDDDSSQNFLNSSDSSASDSSDECDQEPLGKKPNSTVKHETDVRTPFKQIQNLNSHQHSSTGKVDLKKPAILDSDSDDDLPLLTLVKKKALSHEANESYEKKVNCSSTSEILSDSDEDDDLPLGMLLEKMRPTKPVHNEKLRHYLQIHETDSKTDLAQIYAYLNGLYPFLREGLRDADFENATDFYDESESPPNDECSRQNLELSYINRSPTVHLDSSERFILSLKNLKRKTN